MIYLHKKGHLKPVLLILQIIAIHLKESCLKGSLLIRNWVKLQKLNYNYFILKIFEMVSAGSKNEFRE